MCCASVRCEQKRLQRLFETVPANNRIPQTVRQGMPDRRASHTESPSDIKAESVARIEVRWRGTTRSCRVADWRCCRWPLPYATPATSWQLDTISRGTEALERAGSWTPWRRACTRLAHGTSSQCSSVWRSRDKTRSNFCSANDERTYCRVGWRYFVSVVSGFWS